MTIENRFRAQANFGPVAYFLLATAILWTLAPPAFAQGNGVGEACTLSEATSFCIGRNCALDPTDDCIRRHCRTDNGDCRTGLVCESVIDPGPVFSDLINLDVENLDPLALLNAVGSADISSFKCVPTADVADDITNNFVDGVIDGVCNQFFSQDIADFVQADSNFAELALTFGFDFSAQVGAMAAAGAGFVYGHGGEYGCYTVECVGVVEAVGTEISFVLGAFSSYASVEGVSDEKTISVEGIPIFPDFALTGVRDDATSAPLGITAALGFGGDVSPPVSFGDATCTTAVHTTMGDDPCTPNDPCQNSGVCSDDGFGVAECECDLTGFTGDFCDENTNDCSLDSCANGGLCIDGVDSFSCICLDGFGGDTCEENTDDCSPNQCLNGGSCEDGFVITD